MRTINTKSIVAILLASALGVLLLFQIALPSLHRDSAIDPSLVYADFAGRQTPASIPLRLAPGVEVPAPATVSVYRVTSPAVTDQFVQAIGRLFDFSGTAGPADDLAVGMVDEGGETPRMLRVFNNSGGVEYMLPEKMFPSAAEAPVLPNNAEAERIALGYLAERGLLPEEFGSVKVTEGATQAEFNKKTGEMTYKYILTLNVNVERLIDGAPVTGPGQRMRVTIGEGPSVVGVKKLWPDVKYAGELAAKPFAQALADLQAGAHCSSFITADSADGAVEAVVEKVELNYWIGAVSRPQACASPVYKLTGSYLDGNGNSTGSFTVWCDAAA